MKPKVRWHPVRHKVPTNRWLWLAKEFDGPGDWRIKPGFVTEHGLWVVFGASWEPSHWALLTLPSHPHKQNTS